MRCTKGDERLRSNVREVILSNWVLFVYTGTDEWIIGLDVSANANISFYKTGQPLRAAIRYNSRSSGSILFL